MWSTIIIINNILQNLLLIFRQNINYDPGGNLQPAWYHASTTEGFAVLARCWRSAGISTAYHRRGVER